MQCDCGSLGSEISPIVVVVFASILNGAKGQIVKMFFLFWKYAHFREISGGEWVILSAVAEQSV